MSIKYTIILVVLLFSLQTSAESYRERYASVISHYSGDKKDSLKLRAALYLIDNMEGHHSPVGEPINGFTKRLETMDDKTSLRELYAAWSHVKNTGKVTFAPDSSIIGSGELIENVDEAFDEWRNAPWGNKVSFSQFCEYILPYRVKDEQLCKGWRKALRKKYLPLVSQVKDMNLAFTIVSNHVLKSVTFSPNYIPYTFNVLLCDRIRKAVCDERSVLQICILRSLGIPSALDIVPIWADYSTRGHSWVSLVEADGSTYTMNEGDSVALQFNHNDAQFRQRYKPRTTDNCPYDIKTVKRPVKIYRLGYRKDHNVTMETPHFLSDPFAKDVSKEYGLTATIKIPVSFNGPVYLGTFLTGNNWIPIAETEAKDGFANFDNVGSDIVCIAMTQNGKMRTSLTVPFLVGKEGIKKFFHVDTARVSSITVFRKYPLYPYITDQWGFLRGAVFEGANTRDFLTADTLAAIKTMPYGKTVLNVNRKRKYRYLRYKSPDYSRITLAEISYYAIDDSGMVKKISGRNISSGVDTTTICKLYDGNASTMLKTQDIGYWVGMDLGDGNEVDIGRIEFMPVSDTNFIETGHTYELYYFDRIWHLLSRQIAEDLTLTFRDVPIGALLLLKDRTAGHEERIFEYVDGRQVWY